MPDDCTGYNFTAARRGAKDKLRDIAWWLDANREEIQSVQDERLHYPDWDLCRRAITDAVMVFSVNTLLLKENATELYKSVFRAATDDKSTIYAMVTVEEADSDSMGWLYTPDILEPYDDDLERVEIGWWMKGTDRRSQVRDAFWGNYINPHLFKILESRALMSSIERALREDGKAIGDGSIEPAAQTGGAMIYLTQSVFDTIPGSPGHAFYCRRRTKLRRLFESNGLLSQRAKRLSHRYRDGAA